MNYLIHLPPDNIQYSGSINLIPLTKGDRIVLIDYYDITGGKRKSHSPDI